VSQAGKKAREAAKYLQQPNADRPHRAEMRDDAADSAVFR
jgi:hypothetical protein